ncbi:replication-relaxation family protein [Saccharopolyspora sp. ID03-671]|uniref:replication-relaxation family protein n=1 Tax=Saccharopolyspora sp. ID03-671 TaxID=3073066 RepID=UPI0032449808
MVHEHRVLTAPQITSCAFPSPRSGRQRLRELYLWSVLDRFQPTVDSGSAPQHYILGPAGAQVVAADAGIDLKVLGYRRDRATSIAHSQRLAHAVGVGEFFTTLIARAHAHEGEQVSAWWSEVRCARHFGDLVRPDAYGRWHYDGREFEFFLEYDLGTETTGRVAGKLSGYARLAASTGIITPLLIWVPTARREASLRTQLTAAWRGLDHPEHLPIATAAADLLDPDPEALASPAEPIWAPLAPREDQRRALHDLAAAWPQRPRTQPSSPPEHRSSTEIVAPHPMPPVPTTPRTAGEPR